MSNTNCSCNIVRDLLPLYADGETSPETAELINEHLSECEECRRALKQYTKIPHSLVGAAPSGKYGKYHYSEVARRIRRRNTVRTSVICSAFLILGFLIRQVLFSDKK